MARKKKAPAGVNNLYLISFGDTMTALLAFFIVMNSLAEEQSGLHLHAGTGSFNNVSDSMGVTGLFTPKNSSYALQLKNPSPMYIVDGETTDEAAHVAGPDKNGDVNHVADRERDEFHRFLQDLDVDSSASYEPAVEGEVAFDRMAPINRETPFDDTMRTDLLRLAPMLKRNGYELEVRVWATTPAPSAWERAASQARTINAEMLTFLRLRPNEYHTVTATASPWISSDIKRPAASFLVRRTQP